MNIMTRAWEIAKTGVATFGGKVKEYFAEALKMAWAESRKSYKDVLVETLELLAKHYGKGSVWTTDWVKGNNNRTYFKFNQNGKNTEDYGYLDNNTGVYYRNRGRDIETIVDDYGIVA